MTNNEYIKRIYKETKSTASYIKCMYNVILMFITAILKHIAELKEDEKAVSLLNFVSKVIMINQFVCMIEEIIDLIDKEDDEDEETLQICDIKD